MVKLNQNNPQTTTTKENKSPNNVKSISQQGKIEFTTKEISSHNKGNFFFTIVISEMFKDVKDAKGILKRIQETTILMIGSFKYSYVLF